MGAALPSVTIRKEEANVRNGIVVMALAVLGIFSGRAPAFGQAKDQPKANAKIEPVLEVSTVWSTPTVKFGRQDIQPSDGHALLVVAVWVKNSGKGKRLTQAEFNADRAIAGLSVHWENGVGISSSAARLSDANGAQSEPLGVVVGESMAFFKPGRTGLASEVNLGDIPARSRNKPASLLLIFDVPKEAAGLQLNMGTGTAMPVPPPAPAKP